MVSGRQSQIEGEYMQTEVSVDCCEDQATLECERYLIRCTRRVHNLVHAWGEVGAPKVGHSVCSLTARSSP